MPLCHGGLYPRRFQPRAGTQLDKTHELTRLMLGSSYAAAWNLRAPVPTDLLHGTASDWTKTGTIDPVSTPWGVGLKGNGSTGYISRPVSVTALRPHVLLAVFQCNSVSIPLKVAYGLGSVGGTAPAFCLIGSGQNATTTEIVGMSKAVDDGVTITALGPVPVVGKMYAVAFLYGAVVATSARLFVNGVAYASTGTDHTTSSTLVHESIGALKRSVAGQYSLDAVLFAARFIPQFTGGFDPTIQSHLRTILMKWTASVKDVWAPFEPRRIWVPVSAGGAVPTITALSARLITASSAQPRISYS